MEITHDDLLVIPPSQPNRPATAYRIVGRQIANKLANLGEMQIPRGYQLYVNMLPRPTAKQYLADINSYPASKIALTPGTAQQLLLMMYPPIVPAGG